MQGLGERGWGVRVAALSRASSQEKFYSKSAERITRPGPMLFSSSAPHQKVDGEERKRSLCASARRCPGSDRKINEKKAESAKRS